MIDFIICEDDYSYRNIIKDMLNEYINSKGLQAKIAVEASLPLEVIEYVKSREGHRNIYILDISLDDEMSGLALARKIRKYDISGYIIFLTSHYELSMETFKYRIRALDYIIKGSGVKERLFKDLDVAIDEIFCYQIPSRDKTISIKSGFNTINIDFKNIISFETIANSHKIILTTLNNRIEFYGTMKSIKEELDERFFITHKACIINTDFIKEISKNRNDMHVLMKNDKRCLLSRKYIKDLTEHMNYSY